MAFTKTPTQDTHDTKRFSLVGPPQQRNGHTENKDQRFLNCFPELIKAHVSEGGKFFCKKRSGLKRVHAPALGVARGMIYDDTTKKVFFVVGNRICVWDGSNFSNIGSCTNSTAPVGFTLHLTTTASVVLLDGIAGYVINPTSNAVTQITDVDFPSPHVPTPVSLDGYLFVAKTNTADIYNSDLDDPLAWTPGNFITAEMYPDNIIALTKNNNYVVAVGTSSIEFFYDAGIATGSPLQRNASAVQQFGSISPYSVIQTEKEVALIGTTQNGGRTVWLLEGFEGHEIGTEPIREVLNNEGADIVNALQYCIRVDGHKFLVVILTSGRTLVYDFDLKLWHEWSSGATADGRFLGKFACDSSLGYPYVLGYGDNAVLYLMDSQTYQDDGVDITMQITTLKLDFDNMNRKDMYRATVFGDWPVDGDAEIVLEWSDDDYRTWKGSRTIQLSTDLPVTRRLGKFRRRAFRLTFTENLPCRLEGMEVDINIGIS